MKILSNKESKKINQEVLYWREQYKYMKDKFEEKREEVKKLHEKNKQDETEIKLILNREYILENKVNTLESELADMMCKNYEILGLLKKVNSNWQIIGNRVIRFNPMTGKPDKYDFPDDFDDSNIKKFEISDDKTRITFEYQENSNSSKMKKYEMPTTAGIKIGIKELDELIGNYDINDINQINSEKDFKIYLKKNDIDINNKNWELAIIFLTSRRGGKFRFDEFEKNCKFRNRETPRIYLNKLIEIVLVERIKKGVYRILFNY